MKNLFSYFSLLRDLSCKIWNIRIKRGRDSQMSRATITSLFFILGFMAWLSEYSYANVKSLVYNKNDKGGLFG